MALETAGKLAERYLPSQLPDSAIDLLDEAAAALRIRLDRLPYEVRPEHIANALNEVTHVRELSGLKRLLDERVCVL